ncbi:glycosyltransferase family 2 protein [Zobellia uliginosa]|uniref:glycosyltransferase family 2 protein n=1 Tax=Zobellia uliginosa TaxID=143224 RepID=UPI001C0782E9|nr:glycosyltransferase family 2 protein [Zobellia uliginosa]MBU2946732.1 glycosyltransferase [Zobellia uliginosa]
MKQPLVSILIPFKNTEAFLNQCFDSILEQTYENWQIVAVNDHSSDGSRSLVHSYAKNDRRIHLYDNEEKGIIGALRTAYKCSNGKFITRMDSDDIMTNNKLEVMVKSLLEMGKGHLAVGQVRYFSHRGISNGYERYEKWLNHLTETGDNYSEIYKECVIPSPCWMVFREDLDKCNGFTPNIYPEDYDLAFRFYENHIKCIPSSELLHLWRDYDTRTSRTSEHYAENYFLDIKLRYFLKLNRNTNRPLTVWGAGAKGKEIAKRLRELDIDFYWVCDNPKKIGKHIYGMEMLHFNKLNSLANPQSIITVANAEAQVHIKKFLSGLNQKSMEDYFFFC